VQCWPSWKIAEFPSQQLSKIAIWRDLDLNLSKYFIECLWIYFDLSFSSFGHSQLSLKYLNDTIMRLENPSAPGISIKLTKLESNLFSDYCSS
jgi:hypothetical protein